MTRNLVGRTSRGLAALVAAALGLPLRAQQPSDEQLREATLAALVPKDLVGAQLEPSYLTFGGTPFNAGQLGNMRPNLVFEANIAPHFSIRTSPNGRWTAVVTPKVTLRMLNTESRPVRTPCYTPQLTIYYANLLDRSRLRVDRTVRNLWSLHWMAFLRIAHHSNGQEDSTLTADSAVNVRSGQFNANFIEPGLSVVNVFAVPATHLSANAYLTVSYRIQPRHPDLSDPELWRGYGDRRVRVQGNVLAKWGTDASLPKLRAIVDMDVWTLGRHGRTMSLAAAYRPGFADDFWVFGRRYAGQDYYNVHWRRVLRTWQLGVMATSNTKRGSA